MAGGAALPIATGELGGHAMFISVPAHDGVVVFSYGMPAANIVGSALSWIAIALLLFFAVRRYRPNFGASLIPRLRPWGRRAERWGIVLGIGVLLVPVAGIALKGKKKDRAVEGRALIDILGHAKVEIDRGGVKTPCKSSGAGKHQCSAPSWNYVGPSSQRVGDALRRCIWAHPVDRGTLRITFSKQRLGRAIFGHHGLTDAAVRSFSNGAPVTLKLLVDGKVVVTERQANVRGWNTFRYDTHVRRGKMATIGFEISTSHAGGRHFCFDAVLVR